MDTARQTVKLNVRGKRKRRDAPPAATFASSKPRPRGRPLKAASEMKATKKPRTAPPRTLAPAAPFQSWLERLPVELIEQIFLHALEVNMAKASPFLGRSLAKESIYRTLILFAFFDDDDLYPVETKDFAPATYRVLSFEERLRLQQGVLDSRWCTLGRIKDSLSTLRRLVIMQEWHTERAAELEEARARAGHIEQQNQNEPQPSSKQIQLASSVPALDDETAPNSYCSELDDIDYNCGLSAEAYANNCMMTLHKIRSPFSILYFPNRLIDPVSWHATSIPSPNNTQYPHPNPFPVDFLCLVIQGYRLNRGTSRPTADGAALIRGIETAIRQHHREALELLTEIYCDALPAGSSHQPGSNEDRGPNLVNSRECTTRLLHLATKQGKESPWILDTLAHFWLWGVPTDDEVLIKWSLRRVDEEGGDQDRFARWILGA